MSDVIFIHGQESSSRTYKATLLRAAFPGALVPDFSGTLAERMARLEPILGPTYGVMVYQEQVMQIAQV
ncbi:MAG TPA: hypothetical protein PLO33_17385, partial [Kouleothrix sp.]|nr:hypothetical protein [Kouleothrix sp.]